MEQLIAALNALVDARLTEHGLLEAEKPEPEPDTKKPAKGGKKTKAPEMDFDSLKTKITALVNAKGKDAAKELLAKYKVGKLSDLPEAKYGAFASDLDNALEDEDSDLFGEDDE